MGFETGLKTELCWLFSGHRIGGARTPWEVGAFLSSAAEKCVLLV